MASAPSCTTTVASTMRPSNTVRTSQEVSHQVPASRRSDYHSYCTYHNRPPSPPPPASALRSDRPARTSTAPSAAEYRSARTFEQNPNPAATKSYSEVSVAGSALPASRVTFNETESTPANRVGIRDGHYSARSVERIVVDADDGRRSGRCEGRRREREVYRPVSPVEYHYRR
jgi:hypothetical protein